MQRGLPMTRHWMPQFWTFGWKVKPAEASPSTRIVVPCGNSPASTRFASASSRYFWSARLSGRAPYCGSYPTAARESWRGQPALA